MTENDAENDFNNRERAVWPDEPSPFEDPYRYEAEDTEVDTRVGASSFFQSVPETDVLGIRDSPPIQSPINLPVQSPAALPVNEVWLNGPPPDEFPFLQNATPVPQEGDPWREQLRPFEPPFVPVVYTPESTEESVRRSGLAWSAGIVFFGAVAFMLFLGWLADLVLGSTPWGIVVGVVLGSVIGFIQFFRISSQIYAPKNNDHRPFLSRDDDKE